jgi:hypothetical protein
MTKKLANISSPIGFGIASGTGKDSELDWSILIGWIRRVAEPEPELEPEPAGAETFGRSRSRSWSRYTEVSAPAPGFGSGSRAN